MPQKKSTDPDPSHPVSIDRGVLRFVGKRAVLMDVAGGFYSLKKTLRADIGFFEKDFMFRAGQEGAREFLSGIEPPSGSKDAKESLETMLSLYSDRGFGEFTVDRFDDTRMVAEISSTNTAEAWAFHENNDLQREPTCHYTSGVLAWICRSALSGRAPSDLDLKAVEVECVAQGMKACKFVIATASDLHAMIPRYEVPRESISEHVLKLNEEILMKNLELQSLNLSLERQVRKRTEELRRSEDNYRALVNLSPDPIILCSLGGSMVSVNEAGIRMLGYSSLDVALNVKLESLLEGGKVAWDKLIWLLEKEGLVDQHEMELHRLDGSKITAEASARFADFQGVRVVEAVLRDVTERKQMQAEVVEAKSESDFLNDLMSHDITNYTLSALHFSRKLRHSANLTDEEKRMLGVITKDLEGAFELSSAVRDMSMVKSLDDTDSRSVDLRRSIPEAIEEAKGMYSDRKVRFNVEKSTDSKFVKCTTLVQKLFANLFTNCIKYDPSDEVVVDVSFDNLVEGGQSYWVIRVTDRGKGIPDSEKERVFERFHRLDHSVQGTGLGLFVAKFVAKSCGGRIWAENRVRGDHAKGTTMVVMLPKVDERNVAKLR